MSHHHHHHSERHDSSKIDQDENAVTKWLNTMEASLASPKHQFSMTDFSPNEIQAVNTYMHSHEGILGRYERFLPPVHIIDIEKQQLKNSSR